MLSLCSVSEKYKRHVGDMVMCLLTSLWLHVVYLVRPLTVENLDLETSSLAGRCICRTSRSSTSRSLGQGQRAERSNKSN